VANEAATTITAARATRRDILTGNLQKQGIGNREQQDLQLKNPTGARITVNIEK
jgi:hypothetical protein